MAGLSGSFSSFRLRGVDFALPGKCVVNLVNPGNSNGAAAVGLVLGVLGHANNAIGIVKLSGVTRRRGMGSRLNIIFSAGCFDSS